MHRSFEPLTVEAVYGDIGMSDQDFDAALDRSLGPRAPEMLYDKMGALGLQATHHLLDVGCRDAVHTCELTRRFECTAIGIDPVAFNIQKARAVLIETSQQQRVRVIEAGIASLPVATQSVDFIWCRDVLNHVRDLAAGMAECRRRSNQAAAC